MTNRLTLTRSTPANSPLHRICSNSTNIDFERDFRGAYMVDRDPTFFQPILNFLRTGKLILNRDVPEEAILIEAEFYHLPEVVKILKARISQRNRFRTCGHYSFSGPHQQHQQEYLEKYVNDILGDE